MGEQLPRLLMNLAAVVLVYHHHHHRRRQRRHNHYHQHYQNNRQHLLNNSKFLQLLIKIKAPQLLCDGWLTARSEQSFLRIFFTGYMLPSLSQPSMVNINPHTSPHHTEALRCGFVCFPPPFETLRTNSTKWYLTGTLVVSKVPRPICWCGLRNLTALQLVTNDWLWWKSSVSKSKSPNLNYWTKRFGCGQYSKHFASNHREFKPYVLNHQCNHYVHKYLYVMWNLFTKKDNTLNQALLSKAPHISICYQGKSKVRKALIQLQIPWQLLAFRYLQDEKNVRVRHHPPLIPRKGGIPWIRKS